MCYGSFFLGSRFLLGTGAGGAGSCSVPPQVGCRPPQIHRGSFPSLLGDLGAITACCTVCAKSSPAPSARSSLPEWVCHRCRVKSLRAVLGHVCHQPGPFLRLRIHPSCSVLADICGSGVAGKSDIPDKPRALKSDGQQERSRMGLVAQRSAAFLALCPTASGSEGACRRWPRQLFAAGCITCRGALASYKSAAGNCSFSFAWITLVLCLAFSAGRVVWIHITYAAKYALIGQELVPKCQGKIYFPVQPLQVLIFLWAAR